MGYLYSVKYVVVQLLLTQSSTMVVTGLPRTRSSSSSSSVVIEVGMRQHKAEPQQHILHDSGVVTIPLVPHHVHRRRQLQALAGLGGNEDKPKLLPRLSERQPRGYPRRHLQNQENNNSDRRQLEEDPLPYTAQQVAALLQGYGTHYADLWCGTPTPQRQTVIVDTGSAVTAFPCSQCDRCGVPDYHIDALFVEADSSTFQTVPCSQCQRGHCTHDSCIISVSYQEGSSWTAYEGVDRCYVGGLHTKPIDEDDKNQDDLDPFHAPAFTFDLTFGCQTKVTGLFKTQLADGIMGMDNAALAVWKQMYEQHLIAAQAFSLCFSRSPTASRAGTEAGALSLGGSDARLHESPMVFSDTSGSAGFFRVHLRAVYLQEGSKVQQSSNPKVVKLDVDEDTLNRGRVIVDSGTTDTYFNSAIAASFKQVWQDLTKGDHYSNHPLELTAEDLDKFPTIIFQLGGDVEENRKVAEQFAPDQVQTLAERLDASNPFDVLLMMPPQHYFEYDDEVDKYVSRFYVDERGGSVFGANAMMGHDVYFDVDREKVGWAESHCDYTKLVEQYFPGTVVVPYEEDRNAEDKQDGGTGDSEEDKEDEDFGDELNVEIGMGEEVLDSHIAFCSTLRCQVIAMLIVVVLMAVLAWKFLLKSSYMTKTEEERAAMAHSELELQGTSTNGSSSRRTDLELT